MREKPLVKTPVWIAAIALVAVACVALTAYFFTRETSGIADVYVDGKIVYTVDLSRVNAPYEKEIVTPYGVNVLQIEKGKIRVKSADCKDASCVKQGEAKAGRPVACVPHRLVIRLRGEGEADEVAR